VTVGRHLGGAIEISLKVADFRNGSKADFKPRMIDVSSSPGSGHSWGLHPLESAAFARRTPGTDISGEPQLALRTG
jgi:hypothetical protein